MYKTKPVTRSTALLNTHVATAVLRLVEEAMEVLLVMAVGPAVAFCSISRIGEKRCNFSAEHQNGAEVARGEVWGTRRE